MLFHLHFQILNFQSFHVANIDFFFKRHHFDVFLFIGHSVCCNYDKWYCFCLSPFFEFLFCFGMVYDTNFFLWSMTSCMGSRTPSFLISWYWEVLIHWMMNKLHANNVLVLQLIYILKKDQLCWSSGCLLMSTTSLHQTYHRLVIYVVIKDIYYCATNKQSVGNHME